MTGSKTAPMVLVADDEVPTTVMLTRIFEREGYQVRCVYNGEAALETAQQILPDLILLDVQMPILNGFEVLRLLRENKLTASIPTIIVTAKARQPSDVAHGLNLGADDFVHKPFDPRELVARAESKIRARKLEEALQRRSQELEALLRVGEELNQSLKVNEVLNLVPFLVLDLLPGSLAVIYIFNGDLEHSQATTYAIAGADDSGLDHQAIAAAFLQAPQSMLWPAATAALVDGYLAGMCVTLQHGSSLLGMLMLVTHEGQYDENHLRLFEGIGRQTGLSIRNAQLYAIQANYAQHLQEMVDAKTAELQSAQQMLIRAEKLASIGHLAASIAHEINNPLQPIRIILEDIADDLQNNQPIDLRAIRTTQESVERIRRIVSQLLEFAGKRSSASIDIQLIDVSKIVEGVIALNQKFFQKENLTLSAQLSPNLIMYGSKDQLEQVFMNLILNAKAAMKPGGILNIESFQQEGEIVLGFSDTGNGIPEEYLNKIFDPFFSTKSSGTGLGLFVSYGIIQSHHGTIEVQSTVNKGTTFTIRLPLQAADVKVKPS